MAEKSRKTQLKYEEQLKVYRIRYRGNLAKRSVLMGKTKVTEAKKHRIVRELEKQKIHKTTMKDEIIDSEIVYQYNNSEVVYFQRSASDNSLHIVPEEGDFELEENLIIPSPRISVETEGESKFLKKFREIHQHRCVRRSLGTKIKKPILSLGSFTTKNEGKLFKRRSLQDN